MCTLSMCRQQAALDTWLDTHRSDLEANALCLHPNHLGGDELPRPQACVLRGHPCHQACSLVTNYGSSLLIGFCTVIRRMQYRVSIVRVLCAP
jgi:hypothetical protein